MIEHVEKQVRYRRTHKKKGVQKLSRN